MLFTRKGDAGTSGLFGTAERFTKNNPVYEALGGLDELNCLIGLCRSQVQIAKTSTPIDINNILLQLQEDLFNAQAEVAGAGQRMTHTHTVILEKIIFEIECLIDTPKSFIIPGSTGISALLDYARAVSRRVERRVVATKMDSPALFSYLNRLSSVLYALARYTAKTALEKTPSYPQRTV